MILKSDVLQNWVIYMVAEYLCENYAKALDVHKSIEDIIAANENKEKELKPYELCELNLFKVKLFMVQGKNKEAIKYMTKKSIDKTILDDTRKNEILAKLYMGNN